MAHLADESVFFEPAGDKRYYEALGHEVAGDRELALAAWRAFLAEAPSSQYARRARAHLNEVKRAPASARRMSIRRGCASASARSWICAACARPRRCATWSRSIRTSCGSAMRACLRTEPQAHGELRLQLDHRGQRLAIARARACSLSTVDGRPPRTLRRARGVDLALPLERRRRAGRDRRDAAIRRPMRSGLAARSWLAVAMFAAAPSPARAAPWDDVAQPNHRRCDHLIEEASQFGDSHQWKAAVQAARSAVALCPSERTILQRAGETLLGAREYAEGRERLERARLLASRDAVAARAGAGARIPSRLRARGDRRPRRRHRGASPPRSDGRPAARRINISSTTTSATS